MAFAVVDTAGVLTLVPTASDKRTATLDYVDVSLVGAEAAVPVLISAVQSEPVNTNVYFVNMSQ